MSSGITCAGEHATGSPGADLSNVPRLHRADSVPLDALRCPRGRAPTVLQGMSAPRRVRVLSADGASMRALQPPSSAA
ncbi:hypothetical protein XHC_0049 [Xanthomonas hortorum pv. carotae str. M081]|nr:hypothetical protein XHC_0049 [Xanthomonas hortorum pv. carotae str. M081]